MDERIRAEVQSFMVVVDEFKSNRVKMSHEVIHEIEK